VRRGVALIILDSIACPIRREFDGGQAWARADFVSAIAMQLKLVCSDLPETIVCRIFCVVLFLTRRYYADTFFIPVSLRRNFSSNQPKIVITNQITGSNEEVAVISGLTAPDPPLILPFAPSTFSPHPAPHLFPSPCSPPFHLCLITDDTTMLYHQPALGNTWSHRFPKNLTPTHVNQYPTTTTIIIIIIIIIIITTPSPLHTLILV
jgi:hypothetical protein